LIYFYIKHKDCSNVVLHFMLNYFAQRHFRILKYDPSNF